MQVRPFARCRNHLCGTSSARCPFPYLKAHSRLLRGEVVVELGKWDGVCGHRIPHLGAIDVHNFAAPAHRLGLDEVPAQWVRSGRTGSKSMQLARLVELHRFRMLPICPNPPCLVAASCKATLLLALLAQRRHLLMYAASCFLCRRDHRRPGGVIWEVMTPERLSQLRTCMWTLGWLGEVWVGERLVRGGWV